MYLRLEVFKSKLWTFIRPVQRSVYSVFNPQGLKFLTQLHLELSHLNEHRFRNFKGCINPLRSCSLEVENTLHFFFLHYLYYSTFLMGLMNRLNKIDEYWSYLSYNKVSILLQRLFKI